MRPAALVSPDGEPFTEYPMSADYRMTHATGAPVADNLNTMTAGPRGPALLQDIWLIEKLAHFDRELIPERRMHAKGWGAYGTFTVTHDITRYTKAKLFSEVGKKTDLFMRFSTVAGERGAAARSRRASATTRRACSTKAAPASVTITLRVVRSKIRAPNHCSTFCTCADSDGCDTAHCLAARTKLSCPATARTYSRSLNEIPARVILHPYTIG